jgi:DNA-binding MarR family transcriptional regulator
VRELGRQQQLDPGTLSPLLKRLEAAGYVRRERSEHDERVLAVTLTEAGRRLRRRAERIPPAVVDMLGMEIEELQALREQLTGVIEVAQRALEEGRPHR